MAAAKWFDLLDYNSKLERVGSGHGQFSLALELDAKRIEGMEQEELLDQGWVYDPAAPKIDGRAGSPRVRLENLRPMASAGEIGSSLSAFFSSEELKASYTTQDQMRQNERMDGLQARTIISEPELLDVVKNVSVENQSRIAASVARAVEAVQQRRAKTRMVPLSGQGRAIYDLIVPALAEAADVPEDVAGRFLVNDMANALGSTTTGNFRGDAKHGALREHLENLGQALASRDEGRLVAEAEWVTANVAEALSLPLVELRKNVTINPDETEQQAWERTLRLRTWGLDETGIEEAKEAGRLRDYAFEKTWEMRKLTGQIATDIRFPLSDRMTLATISARVPFKVKSDNSIDSQQMANQLAAVVQATQFVADQLSRPVDALMPDQKSIPLRFTFGNLTTVEGVKGQQTVTTSTGDAKTQNEAIAAEEGNLALGRGFSIGVSMKAPYTFIHELGHLIDNVNNFSDAERRSIIEASGALPDIEGRIVTDYGRDSDHGQYLMSEPEIFARMFAASMQQACVEAGDPAQEALGGWMTNHYWHPYAGTTVEGSAERFLGALRDTLDSRRELSRQAGRKNENDADSENEYENTAEQAASRATEMAPGG